MIKNSEFVPAWWLPSAHLQTVWATIVRETIRLDLRRERVDLPDGDFIDIDWLGDVPQPIVLILHGLGGSVNSAYARGLLQAIQKRGWRGAVMHFRGCSGEFNRLARAYHSGDTSDFEFVLKKIKEREPNVPLIAVGYSLGGNVLLKWLGETGDDTQLQTAVAVSVPFQLDRAATHIDGGISSFYQWYLLRHVRAQMKQKFQQFQQAPIPIDALHQHRNFWLFDNYVTAPLHGFSDVYEYYSVSSSRRYLKGIQTPTLILHAKDDPFMPQDVIPTDSELSPCVDLELSDKGGHVGFVTGNRFGRGEYWLDQRIPDHIQKYFDK